MQKLIKSAITYSASLPALDLLEKHLSENQFSELNTLDYSGSGFIYAPHNSQFITQLETGDLAFTLRFDEKIVPASVTTAEAKKIIAKREEEENRRLPAKERSAIRDEVFFELVAKALIKSIQITCFYNPETNLLIVPTNSKKLADIVTSKLLKSLGSIKAQTIYVTDASHGLTVKIEGYLNTNYRFDNFNVEGCLKLKADEKRAQSFKGDDLFIHKEGILEAIAAGSKIVEIELSNDDLSFKVTSDFKIKSISFIEKNTEEQDFDSPLDCWKHEASVQILMFSNAHVHLTALFEYKAPETEAETEAKE